MVDKIDRGSDYSYQPGFPELRIASSAFIDSSNNSKISVSGDIVYGSLIYSNKDGVFEAPFSIEIAINNTDDSQTPVIREIFSDTLRGKSENIIHDQDVYQFRREFSINPGTYDIQVAITDNSSQKQVIREATTIVPSANSNVANITNVSLLAKNSSIDEGSFNQATTYHIPSKSDSLRFQFQVTNNAPDSEFEFQMRLLKFRNDTSIARPMNFLNYSPSSMPYIGIDYDEFEVIQSSVRTFNQSGNVIIEYNFHELPRGNYRLEVQSEDNSESDIYKAIEFSIKSPNFPAVKTPRELARPLYYLMDENEFNKMMSIEDPDELKAAIDRFWLTNIENSRVAKDVLSLYYERVEEANKQFSNFKEGWKTDPGMIYILFGPPIYLDTFSDQMAWYYSYNRNDPEERFFFDLSKIRSKYYPFYNYILQRDGSLYNVQRRQIQMWLSGLILQDSL
ncbi:MAG: GWxTD domain-containing protein [Gracilimonas sp.]|nr:GWxTD domain-containing protein [Gracilimonas sp.]